MTRVLSNPSSPFQWRHSFLKHPCQAAAAGGNTETCLGLFRNLTGFEAPSEETFAPVCSSTSDIYRTNKQKVKRENSLTQEGRGGFTNLLPLVSLKQGKRFAPTRCRTERGPALFTLNINNERIQVMKLGWLRAQRSFNPPKHTAWHQEKRWNIPLTFPRRTHERVPKGSSRVKVTWPPACPASALSFTFVSLQHILVRLGVRLLLGMVWREQPRHEARHGGPAAGERVVRARPADCRRPARLLRVKPPRCFSASGSTPKEANWMHWRTKSPAAHFQDRLVILWDTCTKKGDVFTKYTGVCRWLKVT